MTQALEKLFQADRDGRLQPVEMMAVPVVELGMAP